MGGNGFSSLKNFDTLKEAGFDETQARAILEMMSQDSASKQDLEYATAELKREIEVNKAELKRDIKELDNKITFKIGAASAGVVLTILSCLVTLGKLGLLTPAPTP